MEASGQSYGQALPDQVDRISALFDTHLELISDVRELYRDRAALEREYAGKLQSLAKKAIEKKAKMEASLVVGDLPSKSWDPSSLMQKYSLNAAHTELLDSLVSTAQDHINIADNLTTQVVDVLKAVEKKSEDTKKKELQFYQKLLGERDRIYSDRLKKKQQYDEDCNVVETYRQKQTRSTDDKHADRITKQAEQQRTEMLNSKNIYLIAIAVANSAKAQFYDTNLPSLENYFQMLHRQLIEKFTRILQHSLALQTNHLDILKNRIGRVDGALQRANPSKDQNLFIDYNIRPFTAPDDWVFEPCSGHYDTNDMNVESAPKILLQNKLTRSRLKLEELRPLIDVQRKEHDSLLNAVSSYKYDHNLSANSDEASDNYLEAHHQLTSYNTSETIVQAEIDAIVSAIGDDAGAQQPHLFKSSTFSIPTTCGYCKTSIWGLSKQGKICKLCGVAVHAKCELKIPSDCLKADIVRTRSVTSTMSRTSSKVLAKNSSSNMPSMSAKTTGPIARMLFDFTPTSEFELDISEGAIVHVIDPDDGSGWMKVSDELNREGLVPASYVEHDNVAPVPGSQSNSMQCVRAIYGYEAQGQDELNLIEGQTLELTDGLSGGRNYGDGWWEGINSLGQKGIFPSNYVELL